MVQNCFFNELVGYRKANFRPLTRRLPHSSNVNHCTITIWPKGRWSLLYGLGPKACLAKHISGIWIRNLPVPKDTLACCACLSKCNYVPKVKKKKTLAYVIGKFVNVRHATICCLEELLVKLKCAIIAHLIKNRCVWAHAFATTCHSSSSLYITLSVFLYPFIYSWPCLLLVYSASHIK